MHALNRLTFGPRPGDVEAVRAEGLDKWFDSNCIRPVSTRQTSSPRLSQFPAMQWTPEELLYRLPSNAIIRQTLDGKLPVPERGALHAVYQNQMYRVSEKRQEKEQKKADEPTMPQVAANAVAPMTPARNGSSDGPQTHVAEADAGGQPISRCDGCEPDERWQRVRRRRLLTKASSAGCWSWSRSSGFCIW